MDWLFQLFVGHGVAQSIMALSLAVVLGLALGEISVKGVRLGVGGVLFSGLAIAYLGMSVEAETLEFVRDFGLILFVFCVGMQVGPSFVDSLRQRGLILNAAATIVVLLGVGVTVLVFFLFDLSLPVAVGLFSGAVTNTPSLAASSQTFAEIDPVTATQAVIDAGTSYAMAYPFGICGVISIMLLLRMVFGIKPLEELSLLEALFRQQHPPLQNATYMVRNPNIFGMKLGDLLAQYGKEVIFSRVKEFGSEEIHFVEPDIIIKPDMFLYGVGLQEDLDKMRTLIGPYSDEDLRNAPAQLDRRVLLVTKNNIAGKGVRELGLTPESGVTVTRIVRAGVAFINRPGLTFHYGDKLTCVGESKALDRAESILGNSAKELEHSQIMPIFLGIALGILVGSIPLALPGLPSGLNLGMAGGVLLVAIFLGRVNHFGGMVWYMPMGANLIVREIGIALFLACVGLNSGDRFVAALLDGSGFIWLAAGAMITFLPLCSMGVFMRLYLRYDYATICGFLAGCTTNPAALMFSVQTLDSDAPASVYASVYPLTMILRIICAQLLVFGLYLLA